MSKIRPTQIEPFGEADVAAVLPGVARLMPQAPVVIATLEEPTVTLDDDSPAFQNCLKPVNTVILGKDMKRAVSLEFQPDSMTDFVVRRVYAGLRVAGVGVEFSKTTETSADKNYCVPTVNADVRYLMTYTPQNALLRFEALTVIP